MTPPRPEPITDPDDPRVRAYRDLKDADARDRHGVFVAEGRFVVRVLLQASRFRVRSMFLTAPAVASLEDVLAHAPAGVEVYEASREVMERVVGFDLHRGCVAIGERAPLPEPAELAAAAGPLVLAEDVNNHDNIGGVFRNAAAFGAAGVVLSAGCVDPLYRKAIRVSMGAALRVPFTFAEDWPSAIENARAAGRRVAALTPAPDAIDLDRWDLDTAERARVAWLVGAEGPGLTRRSLEAADVRVRIPISSAVDSLNVSTASAIALHWSGAVDRKEPGP